MKLLRRLHLLLGCFFTPILLFFVVTGGLQVFDLHQTHKDGSYRAPALVTLLSDIHIHQRWQHAAASQTFRWFMAAAAIGFVLTSLLGIIMAFKLSKSKLTVWLCLIAGALVPILLIAFT